MNKSIDLDERKGRVIGKAYIFGKEWEVLSSYKFDFSPNQDWLMMKLKNGDMYMNNDYGYIVYETKDKRYFFSDITDLRSMAYKMWTNDSVNAITLWNTVSEEVKVEITPRYIKFFRRDDSFTCYTYPPLHELKKDKQFYKDVRDCMAEANMTDEIALLDKWLKSSCDMPLFPISVIFHSDYNNYKFKDYE